MQPNEGESEALPLAPRCSDPASRATIDARLDRLGCLQLLDRTLLDALLCRRGRALDLVHADRELDGVHGRLRAQVVHPRLQAQLPAVEVHRRQLRGRGIDHVDVDRLRLVDVDAALGSHVQYRALLDLPNRLVQVLQVLGQVQMLHAAVVSDELSSEIVRPQLPLDQVPEQVPIHLHELAGEHAAYVQVLRVGLKRLIVAKDLRGARSGHRRHQQ
mmetsp:Transcript_30078/g.86588  ORF Transcript_30078/g.86588 Transcript_30078/m.86588 type:complete len:216 (-) Transcript_30078:1889-2536(-)